MKTQGMLAALLALGLAPVLAQEAPPPPPPDDPPKAETPPPEAEPDKPPPPEWKNKGARKQGERLAAEFGVTQQAVFDLREGGLGWGEVRHALSIARRADQPVSEVLKLRDSGMGWGKIAHHYGFKLGDARRGETKADDRDDTRDAVGEPRDAVGERREDGDSPRRGFGRGHDRVGERGRAGERGHSGERDRGGSRGWGRGGSRR